MQFRFRNGPFRNAEMTQPWWQWLWPDRFGLCLHGPVAAELYPEAYETKAHYWKLPLSRMYRFR